MFFVLFFFATSFVSGQAQINNFYEFYKHKARLSDFYIKKFLPLKGVCYSNVCGQQLITSAQAESFIETVTFNLLITYIHNNNLDTDFYYLTTYDKFSGRVIDNLLLRKYRSITSDPNKILYETGTLHLDENKTSVFTIDYIEENTVSSKIPKSNLPSVKHTTIITDSYKIQLTGKFSKPYGRQTSIKSEIIQDFKLGAIKAEKLTMLKNEILAEYNYDFVDPKINKYFINNIKGYMPVEKDLNKIKLLEIDQNAINSINLKIAEITSTKVDPLNNLKRGKINNINKKVIEVNKATIEPLKVEIKK